MAKKIVLLADGTGNGLLVQISNICRLSRALDLARKDQLVYYIPGVGTQTFKPMAMLDGATGFGVPSNVRKLYRFLSWNWEPGCTIYMFGFSRGAFTIRTLVDLIAKEGLLPTSVDGRRISHAQMQRFSMEAWRAYCAKDPSRATNLWVRLGVRRLRDAALGGLRRLSGKRSLAELRDENSERGPGKVDIAFLGLFDTVEAYGVPIEEMRPAVHTLVWPINFGADHTIAPQVSRVRQALSLDDERRTFHPIRIALNARDGAGQRIGEVWFAGVHSDVGGGYPDDMTAHAPLVWMIDEAAKATDDPERRLVFHDGSVASFREIATPFGPLHNSRDGVAVLYRYAPRAIVTTDDDGNAYCPPVVHHTVVERLVDGYDDYAPVVTIGAAMVAMPDGSFAAPKTGAGFIAVAPPDKTAPPPDPTPARSETGELARAQVALTHLDEPDPIEMEIARDYIWLNRVTYFAYVALFVAVLTLPVIARLIEGATEALGWSADRYFAADRGGLSNVFAGVSDVLLSITPALLLPHVQAAVRHPWFVLALVAAYVALRGLTSTYQDAIHYHARQAWSIQGDKPRADGAAGLWSRIGRALRESALVQRAGALARRALPVFVALAFILLPLAIAANRIAVNFLVGAGRMCVASPAPAWVGDGRVSGVFQANDPCWASGWTVERGAAYELSLRVDPQRGDEPWLDQLILTDPYGYEGMTLALDAGTLLRRWPFIPWFRPIGRIGARGATEWPLVPADAGEALSMRGERCTAMPTPYDQTEQRRAYCAAHGLDASCRTQEMRLDLGEALPRAQLGAAAQAWERNEFARDGRTCNSVFPRKIFVSRFVAGETGELFLFVNDAAHFAFRARRQTFYANNTGTATVTLERAPAH